MDVSATFREIVREKRSLHSLKTPKDEILPRAQIKSPFLVEALAIVRIMPPSLSSLVLALLASSGGNRHSSPQLWAGQQAKGVKRMRRYLLDHASDYIDAHRHFANKRARMTDQERDEIDEVRTRSPLQPCHNHTNASAKCVHCSPSSFLLRRR
jgi:hypothetical protein